MTMAVLLDGWESGYDGKRWFYRYKATGMIQYHFPQPGDEFAEFLSDPGTGPLKLTPEESLALEQQTKRDSIPGGYNETNNGNKTSGGKRERKKIADIEAEEGMSANGYFDSSYMYFPETYSNGSPVVRDCEETASGNTPPSLILEATTPAPRSDPSPQSLAPHTGISNNVGAQLIANQLPGRVEQRWSPVGVVAELATQDTLKCAEELAPVELDAMFSTPLPIQTNLEGEPAELPTHRTPTEEKNTNLGHTSPSIQPVDSYPLVSASFAYPPLKTHTSHTQLDSPGTTAMINTVTPMNVKPMSHGQSKYQPWRPVQDAVDQQPQRHNKNPETLPQTSILQNQNSEIGSIGGSKNSVHTELLMSGDFPNALAPPSGPTKPAVAGSSSASNTETTSVPTILRPAHHPMKESAPLGHINQEFIPGTKPNHDRISASEIGRDSSDVPADSELVNNQPHDGSENPEPRPCHPSNQYSQGSVFSGVSSEQALQSASSRDDQSGIMGVNTSPGTLPSTNPLHPTMSGAPGILLFHEIPSSVKPSNHGTMIHTNDPLEPTVASHTPDSDWKSSGSHFIMDEQSAVVAPLNPVKRHSHKSSEVLSINLEIKNSHLHSGEPSLTPSNETSEVISVIHGFTSQGTSGPSSQPPQPPTDYTPGDNSPPSAASMSEGTAGRPDVSACATPSPNNAQSPSAIHTQRPSIDSQEPGQTPSVATNPPKPVSVTAISETQPLVHSSLGNAGTTGTEGRIDTQMIHHPSPLVHGPPAQNQGVSPSLLSQAGNSGNISSPPKPQANTSNPLSTHMSNSFTSPRPPAHPAHPAHALHTIHNHQLGAHSNPSHSTNHVPQQPQVNPSPSSWNGSRPPSVAPIQQLPHRPYGQHNASLPPTVGPHVAGHSQAVAQKPNSGYPPMVLPLGQQFITRPPVGYQGSGSATGQTSPPPPHQYPSPTVQSVSPLQSQVSSPAPSIASLHVSQVSTPSTTFTAVNTPASPTNGPSAIYSPATTALVRPSSMPAHALGQQIGNVRPPLSSNTIPRPPAGIATTQSPPTANAPAGPYPMLPGQVTPLPSQIGYAPSPPPIQQSVLNSHAKPAANIQQAAVGQQHSQTHPVGPTQPHTASQVGATLNSAQSVTYGPAPSQPSMKPPQQQTSSLHSSPTNIGGQQVFPSQPQPQQTVSYQSPIASGQPHNAPTTPASSVGSLPAAGQQYTFPPPPPPLPHGTQAQQPLYGTGEVTSPVAANQDKPSTSTQAAAALTDAGKAMKKWTKNMWKNPALKQTAVGIGAAVMAESVGVNGAAGAQLATSLYANTNRPPLIHAHTAPPQVYGAASMQLGQQPGKPLPHPQPNHQPGPLQLGHTQTSHTQLTHAQLAQQPGVQIIGRPPIVQNPALAAGVAVNFNAQAQAQVGFQQQYPPGRPFIVGNLPPPPPLPPPPAMINAGIPGPQSQQQANVDPNLTAAAAIMVGSAVGAALRPGPSHPYQAQGSGYSHSDNAAHAESHGGAGGHAAAPHEQSSIPPQASETYSNNSYATTDVTFADNSTSSTYVDNTNVINNTIYVDNSATATAYTATYDSTNYVDATYNSTDITTDIASNGDFAAVSTISTDYSGSGWGDWEV